jgi:hypothetical protein
MSADRDSSPSLLSASTVLILSAFLIGTSLGGFLDSELSKCVLLSGLAGVVAFIALEILAFRRRQRAIQDDQKLVEDRLQRHVSLRGQHERRADVDEPAESVEERALEAAGV